MPDEPQLSRVDHTEEALSPSLPGIDTPVGAEQRFKVFVPTPESLMTIGAVGTNDALGRPAGPAGFALRTVENFAAEIHKHTIIDTDLTTTFHTGEVMTAVAGKKLHFSTNGDAQIGTVGAFNLTAGPSAGFVDPALTVEPPMPVPPSPVIDTAKDRADSISSKNNWDLIWLAFDIYKGAKSLKSLVEKRQIAKGVGKDVTIVKANGLYGAFNNVKTLGENLIKAYHAILEAIPSTDIPDMDPGPQKPQVAIHALDGVTLTTPSKLSGYGGSGVSMTSPYNVSLKAGVSASLKSMVSSTVFSIVSSKLESQGVTVVKGKVVTVEAEKHAELIAKENLAISGMKHVGIISDGLMTLNTKEKLDLSAPETWIHGIQLATMRTNEKMELISKATTLMSADKKVEITSMEQIFMNVKKSDIQITDGKINLGIGSFIATIDSSSFVCGNTNIKKSEATMKGTIRLG